MHLKVFVKLKKTLKTLSSGQKNPKNPKKNQKNPKKPTGLGFFKKTRVFSNPASTATNIKGAVWSLGQARFRILNVQKCYQDKKTHFKGTGSPGEIQFFLLICIVLG